MSIHSVETRVQGPQNHLEDFSIFLFPSSIDIYPAEAHLCWERQRAAQQQGNLQSPLNSFIIVSTPDHHLNITLWQVQTLIDLIYIEQKDLRTWVLRHGRR